ncbi:MAG: hypothetical protein ACE5Q3_16080 [Alphaproteobacteria bacterium]
MKFFETHLTRPSYWIARIFISVAVTTSLLLGAALLSRPAVAQSANGPRDDVVKVLGNKYAEAQVAFGLANDGGLIEVFSTRDGSTWTIILTMPNGMSRVVASGQRWTSMTQLQTAAITPR